MCGTFCFSSGRRREGTGAKRRRWAWSGPAGCPRLCVWELAHTDRAHGHALSRQNLRRDCLNHVLDTQCSLTVVPLGTGPPCAAWKLRADCRAEGQRPASPALTGSLYQREAARGWVLGCFPPCPPSAVSACSRSWALSSQPSQGWREHPQVSPGASSRGSRLCLGSTRGSELGSWSG